MKSSPTCSSSATVARVVYQSMMYWGTASVRNAPYPSASAVANPTPLQRVKFYKVGDEDHLHWLVDPHVVRDVCPSIIVARRTVITADIYRSVLKLVERETRRRNRILTPKRRPYMLDDPGPPLSHIPHGSVLVPLASAVSEPFSFSNAQKNSVSLGCPSR